jgi:hypothetical protein
MEWLPTERLDVENVARPPLKVLLPSVAVPSRNITLPAAVEGETVNVNVIDCSGADGSRLESRC